METKNFFEISEKIKTASDAALKKASAKLSEIEEITEYNQQKVLSAFINNRVSEADFAGSTGYGYGDTGRDKLDRIYADIFGAEDAIVRHTFTCGTHTLAVALFGVLRTGDTMLCVSGKPYDTILQHQNNSERILRNHFHISIQCAIGLRHDLDRQPYETILLIRNNPEGYNLHHENIYSQVVFGL